MKRLFLLIAFLFLATPPAQAGDTPTFVLKWGSQGSAAGQFNSPLDATVDGDGNVYVADFSNSRIQKFDSDGTFLLSWGMVDYALVSTVHATRDGYILGGDFQHRSIKKHTLTGDRITQFLVPSEYFPASITTLPDGMIFVVELGPVPQVGKYDKDGVRLDTWDVDNSVDNEFEPFRIAAGDDGRIYVNESDRIQVFDADGKSLAIIGSMGTGPGQFQQPGGMDVDSQGNLYVSDRGNFRVQMFSSDGTFLKAWGSSGSADGQLGGPFAVAAGVDGAVYVVDQANVCIHKFTLQTPVEIRTWGAIKALYGE